MSKKELITNITTLLYGFDHTTLLAIDKTFRDLQNERKSIKHQFLSILGAMHA